MQQIINLRKIKSLLHFTCEKNLNSIINNGLYPRSKLRNLQSDIICNDNDRLDMLLEYSSMSIGFPNYSMFYKYRKLNEDKGYKYCVIGFDKNILLDKDCLFCYTNAASNDIRYLSLNDRKGRDALNKLFDDNVGQFSRNDLNLPINWPTDYQAEVLVKGIIEPKYILGICFDDKELAENYIKLYSNIKIYYNDFYFNNRDFALRKKMK